MDVKEHSKIKKWLETSTFGEITKPRFKNLSKPQKYKPKKNSVWEYHNQMSKAKYKEKL